MDRPTTPFSRKVQFWKRYAVDILFNGRNETFDVINTGGSLIEMLTGEKELCPLVGSEITFGRRLEGGEYGEVFEINFPEKGTRKYVVKVSKGDEILLKGGIPMKNQAAASLMTSVKDFMKYSNMEGDENSFPSYIENGKLIVLGEGRIMRADLPIFLKKTCVKHSDEMYICEPYYAEYAIGNLMGRYYRNGESINFIDMFNFALCTRKSYIFMEQIDLVLGKELKNILSDPEHMVGEMKCILIQILHALSICQRNLVVHWDLHTKNVFLDWKRGAIYKNEKLEDADFLAYEIGNDILYIPSYDATYIVKIGDWGLSVKYSKPMIGSSESLGPEGTVANFDDKYDLNYFLESLEEKMNEIIHKIDPNGKNDFLQIQVGKINKLLGQMSSRTPLNILKDPGMFKKYRIPPKNNAKIIVIGTD